MAQKQNPELQAARASVISTELGVSANYGNFFPRLAASANYFRESNSTPPGTPPNLIFGYSASLTASQNLFSGLLNLGQLNEARSREDFARADLIAASAKLSFDLKSAFAGLLYAQNTLALGQSIQKRREANLKLVQLRFESGRENKGSYLVSQANYEQAQMDLQLAQTAVDVARAELARVLGIEIDPALTVEGAPPQALPPGELPDPTPIVLGSPDYLKAVAAERETDSKFTQARSGFFPTLNVTGSVGNGGSQFFPTDNSRWAIGVSISVPIFNGASDYFFTRAAAEARTAAILRRENGLRAGKAKVKQTYASFLLAVRKVTVDQKFVDAASVRSRIGRQKYDNGLLSFEEWDLIENDYINRQKTMLLSQRDRTVAEANWEQVQGKGVFE